MSNPSFNAMRTTKNKPDHPNTTLCQASTDDPGHKSELVIGVTIQVTSNGLLHNRN